MTKNTYISLAVLASLVLVSSSAFAQTSTTAGRGKMLMGLGMMMKMRPVVIGTVTAVNGTTLTVTSVNRSKEDNNNDGDESPTPTATPVPTIYTVDASHASVVKANTASTVSAIVVGDMVMVQGTITGTNIVATNIRDNDKVRVPKPTPTPIIQGNGQPIIAGTVSAINGASLTVKTSSNITYTVDTTNAKIVKGGVASATLANVSVNDKVVIQGGINGTSVVASSVIDQKASVDASANSSKHGFGGMFHGFGQFFLRIFGF